MPQSPDHVLIFATAPLKPALDAPCNGCGVCCLLEPCPLGVVLSGSRRGPCQALRWQADEQKYRCGAISVPDEVLSKRLPRLLQPLQPLLARGLGVMAARWVAAGQGCDCDAELAADTPAP